MKIYNRCPVCSSGKITAHPGGCVQNVAWLGFACMTFGLSAIIFHPVQYKRCTDCGAVWKL